MVFSQGPSFQGGAFDPTALATDPSQLPKECQKLFNDSRSFVYTADWQVYFVVAVSSVIYFFSALAFFRSRNKVTFMTRSPLTAALSMIMLGIDTVTNTLIFSGISVGNMYHWQCDLGILATVVGQFGFMLATSMRIYRISKVYNQYLKYLEAQKIELTKPALSSSLDAGNLTQIDQEDSRNDTEPQKKMEFARSSSNAIIKAHQR